MSLHLYEEKWFRKAIAGFRKAWVQMVKKADSFEAFVKGIAAVTGLPEATVRASIPAQNWKEFQANADKYLEIAIRKIEAAFRAHKWSEKYKAAFSTTG